MKNIYKVLALILLAMISSILLKNNIVFLTYILPVASLIGKLFLNGLMMVVLPLVITSIILGLAQLSTADKVGQLGMQALFSFVFNSGSAVLIGWLMFVLFENQLDDSVVDLSSLPMTQSAPTLSFYDLLLKMLPKNIFKALSDGEMIGLIVFFILFGVFLSIQKTDEAKIVRSFIKGIFEIMLSMTRFIMLWMPLGAFCLVLESTAQLDLRTLGSLSWLVLMLLSGYSLYLFVVWGVIFKYFAKTSLRLHLKAVFPALLTAFSTSSSSATLPVTLECLEKNLKISNHICAFMLPLGTAVNMAGSSLFISCASLFIAKLYGVSMSMSVQASLVFLSFLTSFGIAGIPSACLVALMVVLSSIGLSAHSIAILFSIERLLDMIRTTVNVYGNTACAHLVSQLSKNSEELSHQLNAKS